MTAVAFLLIGGGLVLVWSGVRGDDVRDVAKATFGGKVTKPVDRTSSAYRAGQEEQADRLGGGRK